MKRLSIAFIFVFSLFLAPQVIFSQDDKPAEYKDYTRLTWSEMQEIANPNRLSHRIFYKPSTGPDAVWFDAVKKGDLATVQKMVESGQDLEAKDVDSLNQTALGWAAFIGYLDIVEYLVSQGANIYATDKADVQSSFKSAILGGNMPVIEYLYPLVKDNLDINAKDENDEETALMVAAWNNRIEAVKFLISKGADVNIVAMKENTAAYDNNALTYACKQGNKEIIEILINAGAINHKTNNPSCDN